MRNNITQQGTPPPQCPAAFINGASHLYVYQEQKSFMQMHSGTVFYSKYSYIKKSENQFQASNYLNGALCLLSKNKNKCKCWAMSEGCTSHKHAGKPYLLI